MDDFETNNALHDRIEMLEADALKDSDAIDGYALTLEAVLTLMAEPCEASSKLAIARLEASKSGDDEERARIETELVVLAGMRSLS